MIVIGVQKCLDTSITLSVLIIKINCPNTVMSMANKKHIHHSSNKKYMYMTGMYIQQVYLHINYSVILYSCNAFLVVVRRRNYTRKHWQSLQLYPEVALMNQTSLQMCVGKERPFPGSNVFQLHLTKKRSKVWILLIQQNKWIHSKFTVRKGGFLFVICIWIYIEAVSVYLDLH